ncbi:MAG: helix-turn-helix domain-containing protein [Sulfolobales archaeon]|nr:helix-turn-helix domain-containing protein [Sulfolobales archaeon]MDW8082202.1 helix-turn-helix domain-containing protein [Sulfolobales archaeon]
MNNQLEGLLKFIEGYLGVEGVKIFQVLFNSDRELGYSDIIARTGLDEQTVRRVLYELNDLGLVVYRRIQSPEDGRFIYYWFINSYGLNQALLNRKRLALEKLRTRLDHEARTVFFFCLNDGIRLSFDEAMELDFKCPKCSSLLVQEDRNPYVDSLRKLVEKLGKEIENERRSTSY